MNNEHYHTPTPWEYYRVTPSRIPGKYDVTGNGIVLFAAQEKDRAKDIEMIANTALVNAATLNAVKSQTTEGSADIVRAVNSYEALRQALIELEQLVTAHVGEEADNWCRNARKALAQTTLERSEKVK
jgi:hypothetical protein